MKIFKQFVLSVCALCFLAACGAGNSREDNMVGAWALSDYADSQQRTPQELAAFQQSIAQLKIDLDLYDDGTFKRVMQQNASTPAQEFLGEWFLENEDKIVTMQVEGAPPSKLLIVELSDTKMVLRVEEGGVSTTLTFSKK